MNKKLLVGLGVILASCTFELPINSSIENTSSDDVVVCLALECQDSSSRSEMPPINLNTEEYIFNTATGVSLLTDSLNIPGPLGRRQNMTQEEEEVAVEKINKYIGLMNQLLNENPVQAVYETSDLEAYSFKMVITITGLDGQVSLYTMYFNMAVSEPVPSSSEDIISSEEITTSEEVIVSSETTSEDIVSSEETSIETQPAMNLDGDDEEIEDEDKEYNDDVENAEPIEDEDKDEYEDVYESDPEVLIEGIVIINGLQYDLIGIQEDDKTAYLISLDQNNWIKIKQEVDGEDKEYKILMKVNGFVEKTKFEIEKEDDGVKLSLFIQKENQRPIRYKFFKLELLDETIIRVEARDEDGEFKAIVRITTDEFGNVVYTYKFDGSDYEHDRDGNKDYHDDEHEHDEEDED